MAIDVFALAKEDPEKQAEIDREFEAQAARKAAAALGAAVLEGKPVDKAKRAGEEARKAHLAARYRAFTVEANELYPAVLDTIEAVLAGDEGIDSVGLGLYRRQAGTLLVEHPKALQWARTPVWEFAADDPRLGPRGELLMIAQHWFVRMLKERVKPLHLRILPGDFRYRVEPKG